MPKPEWTDETLRPCLLERQPWVPETTKFTYASSAPRRPRLGEFFVLYNDYRVWQYSDDKTHRPNAGVGGGKRWIVVPTTPVLCPVPIPDTYDHLKVAKLGPDDIRVFKSELLRGRYTGLWEWIGDLDDEEGWEYVNAKPKC